LNTGSSRSKGRSSCLGVQLDARVGTVNRHKLMNAMIMSNWDTSVHHRMVEEGLREEEGRGVGGGRT
jgi:hypothetical protein